MLEIIKLVREENLEGLKLLKQNQGANFNANERDRGMCALHFAANKGFIEIAQWLIEEAGADINAALNGEDVNDFGGFTPLFLAIQKHDPNNSDEAKRVDMMPLITYLLNNPKLNIKAALTEEIYNGYTVLLFAIRLEKKDVVITILDSNKGKEIISARSAQSTTPYAKALSVRFGDIAMRLSQMGADKTASYPSNSTLNTPAETPVMTPAKRRPRAKTSESALSNAALISAEREKIKDAKPAIESTLKITTTSVAEHETTPLVQNKEEQKTASCCSCTIQ
jgi:ankyrin repeat protein